MKQRVADYIAEFLVDHGINMVFTVVGGGAMHLNDAFGKHDGIKTIHNHHEQACAMAAEGYARINEKIAAVCVTTGPGGTNAMTGVLGAFQDNIPMLIISGQVRYSTTVEASGLDLRQFGEQEYYIVKSVKPMTKYACMIKDKQKIRYELEKSLYLATHGRRGPVWIDIPLDIQGAIIEPEKLTSFEIDVDHRDYAVMAELVLRKLKKAKAPLILAGESIRRSESYGSFRELALNLGIPIVAATCVSDILPLDHPLYFRNFGVLGGRTGNFLVQNADVILSLGCRLSLNQIGFNYEAFAPQAYKIVVDIDSEELKKRTIKIDLPILSDLKPLIEAMNKQIRVPWIPRKKWLTYAQVLKEKFPLMGQVVKRERVNPYIFIEKLMGILPDDGTVVVGNNLGAGMALEYGILKQKQRLFGNRNCGSMGYSLPAAIGAAIAKNGMVVSLNGDGSIQMNLQELQTIICNNIPIKIFIYNNGGYKSIVNTQKNFFDGRLTGCNRSSGLDCPDFKKIATAYGFLYEKINNNKEIEEKLISFLSAEGYGICEIMEDSEQELAFKTTSQKLPNGDMISAPLDKLSPAISEEEFQKYRYYSGD